MADFDITAPDGRKFTVTAPDGATQAQVLAYAQGEFAKMPKSPSTFDNVAKIANAASALSPMGAIAKGGATALKSLDELAYRAGGAVTDMAAGSVPPEVAAGLGAATNMSPSVLLGGAAGKTASPVMESGARRLMQSSLKPSRSAIDSGKADQAITTLLDEGINATAAGAETLRGKVNALQDEVSAILAKHPEATVDKQKVLNAFDGLLEKTLKQGTPQDDMAIIRKVMLEFGQHPLLKDSATIPVQLAQEIKQGIWRKLGEKSFGKGLVPDTARDSQKVLGSGLRAGIEEAAPEVGPLNAKTGEFLNAMKLVEKRSGIEGNKNIVGLGTLSPSLESFLVWMLDRYPAGKSVLARMMHSGQEQIPAAAGNVAGGVAGGSSGSRN